MTPSPLGARFRLAALWLSQTTRIAADNCLRVFVVLEVAAAGAAGRSAAWHLVGGLLALPAVVLAPLNGAVSNSLPKRAVLVGSSAWCLATLACFGVLHGPWLGCWALVALAWVVYSPTRYALLPAAADDARLPLTRVNGWIEAGAGGAVVAGMLLGAFLHELPGPAGERTGVMPSAVLVALVLNVVGLVAAWPVVFPSDVRRPEPLGRAVVDFFRDVRIVLRDRACRGSLFGLATLRGLVTGAAGALVAATLSSESPEAWGDSIHTLIGVGAWVVLGWAVGSFVAGFQGHLDRALSFVALGVLVFVATLLVAVVHPGSISPVLCLAVGTAGGLANVPLSASLQAHLPPDARGNGMAVRNLADYVAILLVSALLGGLALAGLVGPRGQFGLVALLAAVAAGLAWRTLLRATLEQLLETLSWPLYRVRAHGPGIEHFPRRGPVLVVSNHAAWFDPVWLGKMLPRMHTPMMTSVYYDLPVVRWLMVNVLRAIRVEAAAYRREAPELAEAIAALDRGEAVLVFPEGRMRRRADQPLRRFGQGVWHILQQRPATPVVVCWIEGSWGSYFSYYKGRPTVNKRLDWWRPIDVAVDEPRVLDPKLLESQHATRSYLMQACRDARRYLGLQPATAGGAAESEDEGAGEPGEVPS